jgi:uncharacterized protein
MKQSNREVAASDIRLEGIDWTVSGWILFAAALLAGSVVQGLTGFGLALVSVPFLLMVVPATTATVVVAACGLIVNVVVLARLRESLRLGEVWGLLLALLPGVPLGAWLLSQVSKGLVMGALGGVLVGYGLYALLAPELPRRAGKGWAYPAGFIAGLLSGAYNTSGPPLVIYGDLRRWDRDEFRANLQVLFMVGEVLAIASHALLGNVGREAGLRVLVGAPVIALGLVAGRRLERFLDPERFRRAVLILLVIMGVTMLV